MKQDNSVLIQALGMKDELINNRRWLHARPELGFEEFETSEFIKNYLSGLGLEVKAGIAKTGVAALLTGELPGNTIALRADIDALPIKEEYECEYKSQNEGKMHACGHDAHMAILLGAAKLLANRRRELRGKVKFIFQPAEENTRGAIAIIDEVVLQDPEVDLALALHIVPDIDSMCIGVREGITTSSMDDFEIRIHGKGGHGSNPQNTIDPIVAGAQLITALQTIVSRRIAPSDPAVLSICQFIAGSQSNIIPSSAYLSGTIRCYDKNVRKDILEMLDNIIRCTCASAGAGYDLAFDKETPSVFNNSSVYRDFIKFASDILEKDEIKPMDRPQPFSDDFARFAGKVPSLYFFLGTKNPKKDCIYPLHNPGYRIDEDILPLGVALLAGYCLNRDIV